MQSIKVNGVDIEFENGTVEIEDGGKIIRFKGSNPVVPYYPMPIYYPSPYINPSPNWIYTLPQTITCTGDSSTVTVSGIN